MTDLILQALKLSGQRGILVRGWGGLTGSNVSENIFVLESVPHDWLFPQMAAVVHHGGAGTTAAGLRAGIPAVVVPHFQDQPFWGKRVYELGVGPKPIPHKRLTAEKLAKAINIVVNDPVIRRRAPEVGDRIRAEDGLARAVKIIEGHLEKVEAHNAFKVKKRTQR